MEIDLAPDKTDRLERLILEHNFDSLWTDAKTEVTHDVKYTDYDKPKVTEDILKFVLNDLFEENE